MEAKKGDRIEITELFMAKAGNDWNRTFVGTIERHTNPDGSKLVVGKIPVYEYEIIAIASDDVELGRKLDELVILLLDIEMPEMTSGNII